MIESTTEISSLEGTSPQETASTSAHRVPNTLIADYGREREREKIYSVTTAYVTGWVIYMELHAVCLFIYSLFNDYISVLDRVASSDVEYTSFRHLKFGIVVGLV